MTDSHERRGHVRDAISEAMEEEDVDDWDDLSDEWNNSITDFYGGLDTLQELRALLR